MAWTGVLTKRPRRSTVCDEHLLTKAVATHVDVAADDLRFERISTGKFNTSYFVSAPEDRKSVV